MSDDQHWFHELRDGRPAACVELIARFQRRLYAYVRHLGHGDADAQDILQETFSSVWRTIDTLREPAALDAHER